MPVHGGAARNEEDDEIEYRTAVHRVGTSRVSLYIKAQGREMGPAGAYEYAYA